MANLTPETIKEIQGKFQSFLNGLIDTYGVLTAAETVEKLQNNTIEDDNVITIAFIVFCKELVNDYGQELVRQFFTEGYHLSNFQIK